MINYTNDAHDGFLAHPMYICEYLRTARPRATTKKHENPAHL